MPPIPAGDAEPAAGRPVMPAPPAVPVISGVPAMASAPPFPEASAVPAFPPVSAASTAPAFPPMSAGSADPAVPRRADLAAACAAALLVQLLLTPVTVAVLGCLVVTARLTRWRPLWLACPGAAGIGLVLSAGAGRAITSYPAVAARIWALVAGAGPLVPRLGRLPEVVAGSLRLWPSQLPVALIAAAGQAWLVQRIGRNRRTAEASADYRPGALVAARRAYLTATLRRGEVATADGACLGLAYGGWRRAAVSWREAGHGVLCAGPDAAAVTAIGLDLANAAIQHRKAVVIVDLTGCVAQARRTDGARAIASTCVGAAAPLWTFGAGYDAVSGASAGLVAGYDPVSGLHPDLLAERVLAMIDWSEVDETRRSFCGEYLGAALAVVAASRDPRRPGPPLLGELAGLLRPGAMRRRIRTGSGPGLSELADLMDRLEAELSTHPAVLASVQAQLAALDLSALGRWLADPRQSSQAGPARQLAARTDGAASISLGATVTSRDVVVFDLDRRRFGQAGDLVARLVVADITSVLRGRDRAGTPADCLIWINGCEVVGPGPLARLVALGPASGAAVVLGTADDGATSVLAERVGVIVVRGRTPPTLPEGGRVAARIAQRSGRQTARSGPGRPRESDRAEALWLKVREPAERLVVGRAVR